MDIGLNTTLNLLIDGSDKSYAGHKETDMIIELLNKDK